IPVMRGRAVLKETVTYFTGATVREGDLVLVSFQKKEIPGVVTAVRELSSAKIAVRKSSFALKKISRVLFPGLLPQPLVQLIRETAAYYMLPPATLAYYALPKYIIQKSHRVNKNFAHNFSEPDKNTHRSLPASEKQILFVANFEQRIRFYKKEIAKTLREKKQIFILIPEIENANSTQDALHAADKIQIRLLTGKLTPKQYADAWLCARNGDAAIIIGTRQSLFLPFRNLGLIIMEEEESPSYRIWDGAVRYDPLFLAKKLSFLHRARLIIGARIPRVETTYRAKTEGARIIFFSQKTKPAETKIIDIKKEREEKKSFVVVSQALEDAMRQAVNQKQRIILFANRRGYASFILCEDCGFIFHCPKCETPLIFHREGIGAYKERMLSCHRCGHIAKIPEVCGKCQSHLLKSYGVGIERVEEVVKRLFPDVAVIRLDSDTAKDAQTAKEIIKSFSEGKPAILVGTQMMLKHSLPDASLVGIINLDAMLYFPDYRQEERIFYLIAFLRQRAKRKIILQTFDPEKEIFTLALSGNYSAFYSRELTNRQEYSWPPFSRLVKLTFAHRDPAAAKKETMRFHDEIQKWLSKHYPSFESFIVPAFIPRQKGKYVFHIIVKLPLRVSKNETSTTELKQRLYEMLSPSWYGEVDPENLL
ncbi:primosomal protein N', partial [Patescibacteria group bacterium]|nr:primosomal protein N' [Patescibacteria group bacterium]